MRSTDGTISSSTPPATATRSVDPTPPSPSASAPPARTPAIAIDGADAPWASALARIVDDPHVSVAVGVGDRIVFLHAARRARIPASGQKLLTSMAALDLLGADHRFPTVVATAVPVQDGVLDGDLWLLGSGDPEFGPGRIAALASSLVERGVRRVTGDVIGDTHAFSRRWWAPGWVPGLSRDYVARPTALTYAGNRASNPELAAASALVRALETAGVTVEGSAGSGGAPEEAVRALARVDSAPLADLVARQNTRSLNLHAEILLRALGAHTAGRGTRSAGADAVERWAEEQRIQIRVRDGSGLSHGNAVSAIDLTALLLVASDAPWGPAFQRSLPRPGEGTLDGRLLGIPVRAKTGTLFTVPCSTLAGSVRDANGRRVVFAVLSEGLPKEASVAIEDAVVRTLAAASVA